MSKTDKTQPGWIAVFRDGEVVHDHRFGECRVEAFPDARDAARRNGQRHSALDCSRVQRVAEPCPGHLHCRAAARELADLHEFARDHADYAGLLGLSRYTAERPLLCRDHARLVRDPDAPCTGCDAADARPTCEPRLRGGYRRVARVYGAGVPADYRRSFEGPARAAARDALRAAVRDRNANGDTDIEPEPVRHRRSAAWYYF